MTNYFNYLFDYKYLAVSTIRSHKSALAKQLKLGFDIDLNLPDFEDLLQAMALERSAPAKKHITWSLDVVLQNFNKEKFSNFIHSYRKLSFS